MTNYAYQEFRYYLLSNNKHCKCINSIITHAWCFTFNILIANTVWMQLYYQSCQIKSLCAKNSKLVVCNHLIATSSAVSQYYQLYPKYFYNCFVVRFNLTILNIPIVSNMKEITMSITTRQSDNNYNLADYKQQLNLKETHN